MYYTIYRNNLKVATVKPMDSSEHSQKIQSEDIVRLNFTLNTFVLFLVGDYIIFEKNSQVYVLNKPPRIVESPNNYQYECIFEGPIHQLKKTKIFLQTSKTGGGYYNDYKFPLTGNAQTFLSFIVDNLNRIPGNSYVAGSYASTDMVNVEFNNWNAFEAITEICNTLNIGWYLNGQTLHFITQSKETNYLFQVGRRSGLIRLTQIRTDDNIETVVYGFGSTKNLPQRTSYDSGLLTENRLMFVGVDGESKLEKNVDKYGRVESVQEFDDIYPTRMGSVTTVVNERTFVDSGINFNINDYLLPEIKPKLTFITGKLIGITFDISYNNYNQQITLDYYSDESGQYPNDLIHISEGDEYKLFDISLPDEYIVEAETRLQQATQDYLDKHCKPAELYEAEVDEEYLRDRNIQLFLGDKVRIISTCFKIDNLYDIKELTQGITNPFRYSIKFGDVIPKSLLNLLKQNNFKVQQSIYSVKNTSITNNEVNNIMGQDLQWQTL